MTRRYVTERRQANLTLAAQDRAHRCVVCKRAITGVRYEVLGGSQVFDSPECRDEYLGIAPSEKPNV